MKYYLDHNIYIFSLKAPDIERIVQKLKKDKVQCVYSPAHIEEIYTAYTKDKIQYKETRKKLLDQISNFTDNMEFLPSMNGIVLKEESPFECYKRVKRTDTTETVKLDGKHKHQIGTEYYHQLIKMDRHNKSLSNIAYDKIWNETMIIDLINELNQIMPQIVFNYNLENAILGLDSGRMIPEGFQIQSGMYPQLKQKNSELELVIDILFTILNLCGYNADKEEKKVVSGIHDVSHAIYATAADKFFTFDKRYAKRCQAVYYFLGAETEVVACDYKKIVDGLTYISR